MKISGNRLNIAPKNKDMPSRIFFPLLLLVLSTANAGAQSTQRDSLPFRHFIGSTAFVLLTPILDPSPRYYQLNFGYRLSKKDVLSVEAITWAYDGPLGRPYGPDFDNEDSNFPGQVQAFGAGLAYQRFLWRGIYGQAHATAFHQNYLDESGDKIQSGFQLFTVLRFGYHIDLFHGRWFVEPSLAATSWPVNTNLPADFQAEEDKWNKYFLLEPGLHLGFNF